MALAISASSGVIPYKQTIRNVLIISRESLTETPVSFTLGYFSLCTYQRFFLFLVVLHLDALSDGPLGCIIQITCTPRGLPSHLARLLAKNHFNGLRWIPIGRD